MAKEYHVRNSDGDFLQVQNFVLQLVAEKEISKGAFVLYSFYRSVAGFNEIRMGYRYIEKNCGVSKASISNCNKILATKGLIKITNQGPNAPFMIDIVPGANLPRRKLKEPDRSYLRVSCSSEEQEETVHEVNTKCSSSERINTDYKNNTTIRIDENRIDDYNKLIKTIIKTWKVKTKSKYYTKNDVDQVYKIIEPKEALKYVDTMWSLDEVDKWTHKSDHTISVFVHLYLNGKLQAHFENTKAARKSWRDIK